MPSEQRPTPVTWSTRPVRRERVFRDPVHGLITVRDPLLMGLIDAPELQRLRRLRQLGTAAGTYHGAEHSRFGHSLGAMHIMGRVLAHLEVAAGVAIPERLQQVATAAALLHDVGHGPFSHALERVLTPGVGHEAWGRLILQGPTEIAQRLEAARPGLAGEVAALLAGEWSGPWGFLSQLVAGQVDVDRMDYLLRDALLTGAFYGRFDLDRLVHTLTLAGGQVAFTHKGIPTAEEYLLSRHYMYWQVYFHKTSRAQDLVLRQIWRRAVQLFAEGVLEPDHPERPGVPASLLPFMQRPQTSHPPAEYLGAFLGLDDHDVLYAIKRWQYHPDPILSDLARRFVHRRLLKPVWRRPRPDVPVEELERARAIVRGGGWEPEYYCLLDCTSDIAYDDYTGCRQTGSAGGTGRGMPPVLALDDLGRLHEISALSPVIRALAEKVQQGCNLYVPEPCRETVRAALGVPGDPPPAPMQ